MKKCTKCLEFFSETKEFFYKEKKYDKTGNIFYKFSPWCKECRRDYQNQYVKDNIEKVTEYKREYNRRENTIKIKTAHNRMYYKKHKIKFQSKLKKWYISNKSKPKQKIHKISNEEWIRCKQYFDFCCAYCGLHVDEHFQIYKGELKKFDLHKEHVDDKGADDLSNCAPSCQSCNSSKSSYVLRDWYNETNESFREERYNKILLWLNGDYLSEK